MLERRRRRQFNVFPFSAKSPPPAWVHRPLISVVLPVYNHGDFVAEAIESVLLPSRYPVELIIVNDGSTDVTGEVLAAYRGQAGITIIEQENRGLPEALNRGFAEARGSLLTWTSADNRYLPGALDRLADFLLSNPRIGLAYANVRLIDESGEPFYNSSYRPQDQSPTDSSVLLLPFSAETLDEINDNFINACVLFRASIARFAGRLAPEHLGYEDYVQWLRMTRFAPAAHIDTDEPLYQYRLHRNSLTANLSTQALHQEQSKHVGRNKTIRRQLKTALSFEVSVGKENQAGCLELLSEALTQAGYIVEECSNSLQSGFEVSRKTGGESIPLRGCVAPAPLFSHKTHARFHANCGDLSIGIEADSNLLLLPPLKISSTLTRARDTSYGAVTPAESSGFVFLSFPPDASFDPHGQSRDALAAFMTGKLTKVTFAFFCETAEQRRWADQLYLSNRQAKNIRIIDITGQSEEQAELSLMYVLSSVDAILAQNSACSGPIESASIRVEAGLAAAAGIPLLTLGSLTLKELEKWYAPIPHLAMLNVGLSEDEAIQRLRQLLPELKDSVDQNSQEQWLKNNSYGSFGRILAALSFP